MECYDGCFDSAKQSIIDIFHDLRNNICSLGAGIIFAVGWCLFIDSHLKHPGTLQAMGGLYVPGIVGSAGLLALNMMPASTLSADTDAKWARIVLFFLFIVAIASFISSIWIMSDIFIVNYNQDNGDQWVGVALFLQGACILSSNALFRFGRRMDEY